MKDILSIAALAAVVLTGAASGAEAGVNLVQDGNFSQDTLCCAAYGVSDSHWRNVGYYGGSLHGVYNTALELMNYPQSTANTLPNAPGGAGGTNYYYSDGGPNYQSTYIYQTITGLTPGKTYSLTFKDAFYVESQGSSGDTAQWAVNWGGMNPGAGSSPVPVGGVTKYTQVYNIDGINGSGWYEEAMSFVASSTTQDLAFKAIGTGYPPFALVTDISLSATSQAAVPEPAAWALMIIGVGGIGALARRRRALGASAAAAA